MKMSRFIATTAATLCLIGVTFTAAAEFDRRVYLTPAIGATFADRNDMDAGMAFGLLIGKPISPHFNIELDASYSELEVDHLATSLNTYERTTLGLNLVGFFARDTAAARPFVLLNGNGRLARFLGEDLDGVGLGVGAGSLFKLGERWSARLDLRYNLDFIGGNPSGPIADGSFYTWQGLLGIGYHFGNNPYDDDRDGVPNSRDRCPGTPQGVRVAADGCPVDSDGDGVPDHLDQCPNTPQGMQVGTDGCERDSDGDGVPDSRDRCPGTPRGARVNADGCVVDADGDGVPDALDECVNTPPGAKVLPNGCALKGDCRKPRPGEAADARGCALDRNFVLRGVKFEYKSDQLTPEARAILNDVAETLRAYPDVAVELEGHTDSIGSDAYNQGLSERRSNSVKVYLIDRGVPAARMTPIGYGESRPIDTNETDAGRENNRRVELKPIE